MQGSRQDPDASRAVTAAAPTARHPIAAKKRVRPSLQGSEDREQNSGHPWLGVGSKMTWQNCEIPYRADTVAARLLLTKFMRSEE